MVEGRAKALGVMLMAMCAAAVAGASFSGTRVVDDTIAVDRSVTPGDDFYGYANNLWIKTMRLPEGQSRIDTTAQLRAENARRVKGLIEDAARATAAQGPVRADIRMVADYYASRLDQA